MVGINGILTKVVVASLAVGVMARNGCTRPGDVAIVIDGLSVDSSQLLREQKTAIAVVLDKKSLGQDNIVSQVEEFKKAHIFGYRFNPSNEAQVTEESLKNDLEWAVERFTEILNLKLKYVLFPETKDRDIRRLYSKVAKKVGLTVIKHNLYLEGEQSRAEKAIKLAFGDAKETSYVTLASGYAYNTKESLSFLKAQAEKKKYSIVPLNKCLSGSDTDGDESNGSRGRRPLRAVVPMDDIDSPYGLVANTVKEVKEGKDKKTKKDKKRRGKKRSHRRGSSSISEPFVQVDEIETMPRMMEARINHEPYEPTKNATVDTAADAASNQVGGKDSKPTASKKDDMKNSKEKDRSDKVQKDKNTDKPASKQTPEAPSKPANKNNAEKGNSASTNSINFTTLAVIIVSVAASLL